MSDVSWQRIKAFKTVGSFQLDGMHRILIFDRLVWRIESESVVFLSPVLQKPTMVVKAILKAWSPYASWSEPTVETCGFSVEIGWAAVTGLLQGPMHGFSSALSQAVCSFVCLFAQVSLWQLIYAFLKAFTVEFANPFATTEFHNALKTNHKIRNAVANHGEKSCRKFTVSDRSSKVGEWLCLIVSNLLIL